MNEAQAKEAKKRINRIHNLEFVALLHSIMFMQGIGPTDRALYEDIVRRQKEALGKLDRVAKAKEN